MVGSKSTQTRIAGIITDKMHTYTPIQWRPSITDTTGTKDFVLYSKVSFAQGVIVDHAPSYNRDQLCWNKTTDHEISCIDKRSIVI